MNDRSEVKPPADEGPVQRQVGRLGPERGNTAIAQALERLRYVDRSIWDDVEAALRATTEDHHNPELDELDCTLLLDLLWLYRHAEPLLTGKAPRQLVSVSSIDIEKMLAACVPGGSFCDPQQVADAIRRYCDAWPGSEPPNVQGEPHSAARTGA